MSESVHSEPIRSVPQSVLAGNALHHAYRSSGRIQDGIDSGELPVDTAAMHLANFYATIYQGMSMQSKDGATHVSLMATVRTAMRSWPRM